MKMVTVKQFEPAFIRAEVEFIAEDIALAFGGPDPDEELFFDLYGPGWEGKPISERLSILSRVALAAEGTQANNLGLVVGEPEPKEIL